MRRSIGRRRRTYETGPDVEKRLCCGGGGVGGVRWWVRGWDGVDYGHWTALLSPIAANELFGITPERDSSAGMDRRTPPTAKEQKEIMDFKRERTMWRGGVEAPGASDRRSDVNQD
ncbi:hypothetical protein NL108_015207 [Boleophthalmus pectinirostris]|nr:hypothetical protein NL108_015207 [Boleophthalmus pectinirostris]